MKKICILTPIKNEQENISVFIKQVLSVITKESQYKFQHIFLDNDSNDNSAQIVINKINNYPHIGLIQNQRDFGWTRSIFNGLSALDCDAVIVISCDLQEPPELIKDYLREWEKGHKVVGGVRQSSNEKGLVSLLRKFYYKLMKEISNYEHLTGFIGFGLYDKEVIDKFLNISELEPYFRGLPSEFGYKIKSISYHQPKRIHGESKLNFFKLFDLAMSGIVSQTKAPIRIATFVGIFGSLLSALIGFTYFILKLIYWDSFQLGLAPALILISFTFSVQFLFFGLLGEYIAKITREIVQRPYVIEKSRVNVPPEAL